MTSVPLYDYRCGGGHRFEAMAPMDVAPLDSGNARPCPVCGGESAKVPSRVSLGGLADAGRPMELMPQTWRGTYEGNREYLGQLRREWSAREKLEDRHEELRGDRRPILAHEGRFHGAPLRAGDDPAAHPAPPGHGHAH